MSVRPRGKSWEVILQRNGSRFRRSVKSEAQARALDERLWLAIEREEDLEDAYNRFMGIVPPSDQNANESSHSRVPQTLGTLFKRVHEVHWSSAKSSKHIRQNTDHIEKILGSDLPLFHLDVIENPHAMELIDRLVLTLKGPEYGNGNGTINRKLAAFSKALTFAYDRHWIAKMPKIKKLREGQNRIRYLTDEEEQEVLLWCDWYAQPDFKDLVIVLIDTGMRLGECLGLDSTDIDLKVGFIRLSDPARIKNGMPRCIPMTKRVREIVQRRSMGGRLWTLKDYRVDDLWDTMRRRIGKAGDRTFVVHALRHTCASRLVQRKVPLKVVQEWLGHKALVTTLRYAHLDTSSLLSAASVLEPQGHQKSEAHKPTSNS